MTRQDALNAPCPYHKGKTCIADRCPKWRWITIRNCTSRGNNYDCYDVILDSVVWNCQTCPHRQGYCQ